MASRPEPNRNGCDSLTFSRIGRMAMFHAQPPQAPHPSPARQVPYLGCRGGPLEPGTRLLAEECPVALTFNGSTYAVMMASPCDLEDFALGFGVTEGIVAGPDELGNIEILAHEGGYEVRTWVSDGTAARLAARRRHLLGPVGCGLCGLESIEEATRPALPVSETAYRVSADDIAAGLRALEAGQDLNRLTRSHHAAGFWDGSRLVIREDVGRHNALDKLAGALSRRPAPRRDGIAMVTSRISVDLVQKATRMGLSILVAISAPTALAVRAAETAGLTLVGVAREDGFEVYSRPDRIS